MRWIRDRAFPVRNAQGEVYRIAGLAEDITERKQTREALQTQAAILENMAEGVVVTDEQGLIVQMNPAAERIWGYQRNEVLGQPASVFSALPEPEATAVMQRGAGGVADHRVLARDIQEPAQRRCDHLRARRSSAGWKSRAGSSWSPWSRM